MPASGYTPLSGELFTPQKVQAFVDRLRPNLDALAPEVSASVGLPSITVTVFAAAEPLRHFPVRGKGNGIIRAGEVPYAKGALHPTTVGLFVEWATERVFRM